MKQASGNRTIITDSDQLQELYPELGKAIHAFSVLEVQLAGTISTMLGATALGWGSALVGTIDAVNKQKLLTGVANILASERARPGEPSVADAMKTLGRLFQELLSQRNILAHGILSQHEGRAFVGSLQLSSTLRVNGGADKWVWIDELPEYHRRCHEALGLAIDIEEAFSSSEGAGNLD